MPQNVLTNESLCVNMQMTRNVARQKRGDKMQNTAGKVLRGLRKGIGKTIPEVASDIGISYQSMQAYEDDKRSPRDEVKKRIARYYNKTVGFIFFNE